MIARQWNPRSLIVMGLVAGGVQVAAGVAMYLAGVYFAPWSMLVSLAVLLVCIVAGTRWYTTRHLNEEISWAQALAVGAMVSLGTGLVYGIYNIVSISFFYPDFLDSMVQATIAQLEAHQRAHQTFAEMRAEVSVLGIAVPNVIRLTILGTLLSLVSAVFLKRPRNVLA